MEWFLSNINASKLYFEMPKHLACLQFSAYISALINYCSLRIYRWQALNISIILV